MPLKAAERQGGISIDLSESGGQNHNPLLCPRALQHPQDPDMQNAKSQSHQVSYAIAPIAREDIPSSPDWFECTNHETVFLFLRTTTDEWRRAPQGEEASRSSRSLLECGGGRRWRRHPAEPFPQQPKMIVPCVLLVLCLARAAGHSHAHVHSHGLHSHAAPSERRGLRGHNHTDAEDFLPVATCGTEDRSDDEVCASDVLGRDALPGG
eukprot:scaffold664_cov260-Pinguiococcus_pyrenoidosus.AAC.15